MFQLFNLDEEYARYPEIKREDVLKLLHWSLAQPHLPKITEHEALIFFYACDCSMEYSKQVMDLNGTCRTHFEEFFHNVDIDTPQMEMVRQTVAGFPLDQRTSEGYLVVLIRILDTDPSKFNFANSIKLFCIGQDKWGLENGIIRGLIFALDLTGVSFGHIARVSIMQLKKVIYYLQEAMPARLVGLHFINAGTIIDKVIALMNPFMKKELHEILHVHTTMETFYKFVPRDMLPQEYGGPNLSVNQLFEQFFESLRNSRLDIIEYNRSHRVNEKLRPPARAKPSSDIFGTEGNFKKLDID